MLKPIHRVSCAPALAACKRLMQDLIAWLCAGIGPADVSEANCAPPRVATPIEGAWLWEFLRHKDDGQPLVERARTIAGLSAAEKQSLLAWAQAVAALAQQFGAAPPAGWPTRAPITGKAWADFKSLMEAFYTKALRSGLPYLPDGTPTRAGGVSYASFLQEFRARHRVKPHPDAKEVCVLCGGPLGDPEVDHWVAKGAFPLLAVCADNLLPICGTCNSHANKGEKSVHTAGSFQDWFHPYLRHANVAIRLEYDIEKFCVTIDAVSSDDAVRVRNLDGLLNLRERWTREFKAEHVRQLDRLRDRRNRRRGTNTLDELRSHLEEYRADLQGSEPHHEVHRILAEAMLDPARIAILQSELGIRWRFGSVPG